MIKRNALTQSRLTRDLLDLSRLRSGKISLNTETVSLSTSIKNAVETVCSDADAKDITIEVIAPSEPLFVNGERAASFYSDVTKPFELEALVDVLLKLPKRTCNGRRKSRYTNLPAVTGWTYTSQ